VIPPIERWRGKWALVTGASAGIGRAFVLELAAGRTNVVLVARRRERLEELAAQLVAQVGVRAEICAADLANPEAAEEILNFTREKGIEIDLLINNAGFGVYGEFSKVELNRQLEMVNVNISAVTRMTHVFAQPMMERRRGDILILSSTAAFQPVPHMAVYAATKAFDLHFAEAIAEEMSVYGIGVCALCPGSTVSEFHSIALEPKRIQSRHETAEKVARTGLEALAAGRSYVISGAMNYISTHAERLATRRTVARVAGKMLRPRTGDLQ
jgi:short-subunit dehydrogenase